MNIEQVAKTIVQKMNLNPTQQNSLMQSIEKANALINSTNNPIEALKKENVDPKFLGKVREWLNTPAYSLFLPMLGVNKKVALEKLDSLEKLIGNNNSFDVDNIDNSLDNNVDIDDNIF